MLPICSCGSIKHALAWLISAWTACQTQNLKGLCQEPCERSAHVFPQVFAHNDVEHLEVVLRRAIAEGQPRIHRPWKKILIVVEGIYSMEGEMANLAGIVALKKKYKVRLCKV